MLTKWRTSALFAGYGMPAAISSRSSRIPSLAAALALLAVGLLLTVSPVAAQTSDNANLSSLSILGTGVTGFSANTTSYTVNLDTPEGPATVAAAAEDTSASVAHVGADVDLGNRVVGQGGRVCRLILDAAAVQAQLVGADGNAVAVGISVDHRIGEQCRCAVDTLELGRLGRTVEVEFQLRDAGYGHVLAEGHSDTYAVANAVGVVIAGVAGDGDGRDGRRSLIGDWRRADTASLAGDVHDFVGRVTRAGVVRVPAVSATGISR